MIRDIETVTPPELKERIAPFLYIWRIIGKKAEHTNVTCSLRVASVGSSLEDAFNLLRYGNTDYVYVDGIGNSRLRGLLCTDSNRQLATVESCFFVGEYTGKCESEPTNVAISGVQMQECLGEGAAFLLCHVVLTTRKDACKQAILSLTQALEEMYEK